MSEVCVNECNQIYSLNDYQNDVSCFLAYLKVKGRKDSTIYTYNEALRSIYKTLCSLGLNRDVRDLTGDDIISIKESLNIKETSKKLYLIVLGRMVECLGYSNPYKDADMLWNHTEPRRLFIRPDDFRTLLIGCDERERLILMLGAYMGLRRSEIANIRLDDIQGQYLRVYGKGHGKGKEALLRIPRPVLTAIETWKVARPYHCDYLLTSPCRPSQPMSPDMVANIVKRIAKRNHIVMTSHSLRRLFATTLYECGIDLNTIRTLTRHESISTLVNCYINVNPIQKDNAIEALCVALA